MKTKRNPLLEQQISILAEIRKFRYKPKVMIPPRYSPFYSSGGTYMMKIARIDAEKILAAARARKQTCAQVVHTRDW